ncbi:GntR family transcriptional regulator [Kocuria sp.]|uniref:GntR family transcriptional regulator n=1 Tax=Kocuria sp. TaxID=1871328 RepID=UPI0026DEF8E4|nr:GntR family transcriptional regulator [Kocuria sp.]MDO5617570.1 GntR family transcriptional regulator [Kocuria sp.]
MTYRDSLAETLRQKIIDGEFMPGARLSESALTSQLDVSRNTLREAYRVLAEQGLLVHVPHRGVSVAAPTVADVVDIYRCRRNIEGTSLRQAQPHHPGVSQMMRALEQAENHAAQHNWLGTGSANMAFHEAIVSLADSPRLLRMYRNVAAELRLVFLAIDDPHTVHEPFVQGNRGILSVFNEQGPVAAAEELERYLLSSERNVLGAYSRAGKS